MPDRHKNGPMSVRLPGALSAWVARQAARTGRTPHRVVVDAVAAAAGQDTPAVPQEVTHRCPVKGWCEECQETKGSKR